MVSNLIGWSLQDIKYLCLLLRYVETEELLVPLRKSSWGKKSAAKQVGQGSLERSPDFSEAFHFHSILKVSSIGVNTASMAFFLYLLVSVSTNWRMLKNYFGLLKCDHLPEQYAPRHNSRGQNICRRKAQVMSPFPPLKALLVHWTFRPCSVLGAS